MQSYEIQWTYAVQVGILIALLKEKDYNVDETPCHFQIILIKLFTLAIAFR